VDPVAELDLAQGDLESRPRRLLLAVGDQNALQARLARAARGRS
jgi:hypothetical protein